MSTQDAARQYHTNMTAMRNREITADEFRARVRAMRTPFEVESYLRGA